MERITEKDRLLPGYAPRDVVDFRDVFGGPPRRHSSIQESRIRSRPDSLELKSFKERRSASRLLDKPVFGGVGGWTGGSPARRSHLGDDFFSDIFPGSDSSCSSPRKREPDPFPSSSPGSRVLSPARPMASRGEPLVGGSSLLAQLSLSMKLAKETDHPSSNSPQHTLYKKDGQSPDTFGIPSSPSAIDDMRVDSHVFYRQSPLSCEVSHDLDESSSIKMEVLPREDLTSLEGFMKNGQFHFSIYKWACKGVTLIMPSNPKGRSKSGLGRLPEVVLQEVGLPSYNDDKPTPTTPSKSKTGNQDRKLLKDLIVNRDDEAASTTVEELLMEVIKSKSLHSDVIVNTDAYSDNSKIVSVTIDGHKPEMKNLHQLLNDDLGKQGNDDTVRQPEEKENYSKGGRTVYDVVNAKQQAGRESIMEHVEVVSPSIHDVQVPLEDKMHGNRVKGKVKDFIKIFNHESSPKRKDTFETQTRSSKGKNEIEGKVEGQFTTSVTKRAKDMKATSGTNNEPSLESPIRINKISKAEKTYFSISSGVQLSNESLVEHNDASETFSKSTPEVIKASECNTAESHSDDLDVCFVEQLSQDPKENLQTDSPQDQIKISDTRIHDWSKGKEGNIRALLSTLQYVLWPESGWKPVRLVDIIEGTSVKRAYQKAMLYLHPDKLQQKAAAMHQKYIAEKVFDILQEAWDHFNSTSSF